MGRKSGAVIRALSRLTTIALVASLAAATAASASAFPGVNGQLVFTHESATAGVIATSAPDGSGVRALTTPATGFSDSHARVSSDGSWIVFVRFGYTSGSAMSNKAAHLMIMRSDGSCLSDISTGISAAAVSDGGPSFAPGGGYIVFDRFNVDTATYTGLFKETLTLSCTGGTVAAGTVTQLTSGQDANPTVSPDGTKIAFERSDATATYVYTAALSDPSTAQKLTDPLGGYDSAPDYSPDGSKIAFARNYNSILVTKADGSGSPTTLVAASSTQTEAPAFSPDGTQVIFQRSDGIGPGGSPADGLYKVPAAGGTANELQPLSGSTTDAYLNPDWGVARPASCTGRLDGEIVFKSPNAAPGLTVVNPDGTGIHQIVTTPSGYFDQAQRVSPDGTTVVFQRQNNATGLSDIYVAGIDGNTTPQDLTPSLPAGTSAVTPTFSADGTKIVFAEEDANGLSHGLYVMNADGMGTISQIVAGNYTSPTIPPGGTMIAFIDNNSGGGALLDASFDAATGSVGSPSTLVAHLAQQPYFAPDGTKIAYSDGYDIWTVPAAGGSPTRLTRNVSSTGYAAADLQPVFSPDGTKITLQRDQYSGNLFTVDLMNADGTGEFALFDNTVGTGAAGLDWQTTPCNGLGALSETKTVDKPTADPGSNVTYTITISNPNTRDVSLGTVTDTLPSGFTYQAGSSSGATTADPQVSSSRLTWTGPITVPERGSVALRFTAVVAGTTGVYYDTASATSTAATIMPTGPAAPVEVKLSRRPTATSVSCSPPTVVSGSQSVCTATVTDTGSGTPSAPDGAPVFGSDDPKAGFVGSNACTLSAISAGASSCSVTFRGATVRTDTVTAVYDQGSGSPHGPSSGTAQVIVTPVPSQLTVHVVFSCPSNAPPCGAPYPPSQPPQPGAGRVLGLPSNPGVGTNFDCWAPQPPPNFTESSGFAETCSLPVSAGQTFDLTAYAGTYGNGSCSLLFCPGTGWPPWKVSGFSSSSNVSGCSGSGATCAATMGAGQNDVTVTLAPADQPPHLGSVTYGGKGIPGFTIYADSSCRRVSGQVDESTCTHPWPFAAGAADGDHDPHLSYDWSWGDGTADNCPANVRWNYLCTAGGSMAHSYADPGTYTVKVTATDQDGITDTTTTQITIVPLTPLTTLTFSQAMGSTVASTSQPGGTVSTQMVLPTNASQVTLTSQVTGCGQQACTAAARRLLLGRLTKRHLNKGALVLTLRPTNRKLLNEIKVAQRRARKHSRPATLTIVITLTTHKTIRIVQHIKLSV